MPASVYPAGRLPDAASALVDAERKAAFEEEGAHYESAYYLTFLYLPPAWESGGAERFLYEGRNRSAGADAREILAGFTDRTERVLQLLDGFMPECHWLDDGETLTYLHSCISTRRQRVRVPEVPMYLDGLLSDQPLTGGLEPKLGDCHLRVLTIVGFPGTTTPGLLDELNRLAFAHRWSTRAILLDKTDATRLLTRIRRQWFAKRKSIAAILKEVMTNEASTLVDTEADVAHQSRNRLDRQDDARQCAPGRGGKDVGQGGADRGHSSATSPDRPACANVSVGFTSLPATVTIHVSVSVMLSLRAASASTSAIGVDAE